MNAPHLHELSEADEIRILSIGARAFIPILRRRQQAALNRLIGAYKQNRHDDLRICTAEYCAHTDLLNDIEFKLAKHNEGE